jgi:GTP-binding protein HflX
LVAAFRATLEEVLDADLILHVRDISHPQTAEQAEDVKQILSDLGVAETVPLIEVWNKTDLLPGPERDTRATEAARREGVFAISALTGAGLDGLLAHVAEAVSEPRHVARVSLPHSDGKRRAWLYERGIVEAEASGEETTELTVRWTDREAQAFRALSDPD